MDGMGTPADSWFGTVLDSKGQSAHGLRFVAPVSCEVETFQKKRTSIIPNRIFLQNSGLFCVGGRSPPEIN